MYAVISTGGRQYTVSAGDRLKIEKIEAEVGSEIDLDNVLLVGGKGDTLVGTPVVDGAVVKAKIASQGHDRTITVFKKRRRHNYRRSNGHRQLHTILEIKEIALP